MKSLPVLLTLFLCSPLLAADPPKLPFTIGKETTAATAPLLTDGTPDFAAAINERYSKGVTSSNNAFVSWVRLAGSDIFAPRTRDMALKMMGIKDISEPNVPLESFDGYLKRTKPDNAPQSSEILKAATRRLWVAEEYPELAAYLDAQRIPLSAIAAAVARERWWIPCTLPEDRPLMWMLMPGIRTLADAPNALCARALLQFRAGKWDDCVADLQTAARITALTGTGFTVIERLVAVYDQMAIVDAASAIAASGSLSEAQCRQLAKFLGNELPAVSFAEPVDVLERYSQASTIVTIAMGQLDRFKPEKEPEDDIAAYLKVLHTGMTAIQPDLVDWDAVLRLNNELVDQQVLALKAPTFGEMSRRFAEFNKTLEKTKSLAKADLEEFRGLNLLKWPDARPRYTEFAGRTIVSILATDFEKSGIGVFRLELKKEMVQTLLAAAEVRAATGRWPQTLDALTAAKAVQVPRDIYSTEERDAIRYRLTPQGPLVYSIGPNGRDDEGVNDSTKRDDVSQGISVK